VPEPTSAVTVVIPCFNAGPFLRGAIESVLAQTLQPCEVIVVDDASTDDSVAIASSFGPLVRVVRCPTNSGYCVVPKDIGLDEASHEFVAFLDADDLWLPQKLELQMPRFRDPRVGLVYGRARTFETGSTPHGAAWPDETPVGNVVSEFYFRCYPPNSTVVARRAALVAAGGFDRSLDFCEDFDLWLRAALEWRVDAVPDVVMLYRKHPGQASGRRAVQARAHRLVEERHANALKHATGISEEERRRGILNRLLGQLESEFYNQRDLGLARLYADFIETEFPDMDAATRATVRRLRRRTYLPRALFTIWDQLHPQPNG